MKIIINNPTSDNLSYLSGTLVLPAGQTIEISEYYWLKLKNDLNFIKDLRLNNILLNDGINDYSSPDSERVFLQTVDAISLWTITPFSSKTLSDGKRLFARNTGFKQEVGVGLNTIEYTGTFPWVKILGVEIINCSALDMVDFKVYDSAQGTYSGVPNLLLNQFSYSYNLPKDFHSRISQFDSDFYQGMKIVVEYTSVSAKTVGINLIMNEVKS